MFDLRTFLVKERAGLLKLTDTYDIFDPATNAQVAIAMEEIPGFMKLLRLLINKQIMPTTVNIYEGTETNHPVSPAISIRRGPIFFRSRVEVRGPEGNMIGYFKQKFFSLGGAFMVFDPQDQQIAEIKGDWKGWNFKITLTDGQEIGVVAKKWAGLAKEFFTSADNYVITLSDGVDAKPGLVMLLLAAGIAIDTVFKEKNG